MSEETTVVTKKMAREIEKEFIDCIKRGEGYDTWTQTKVVGKGENGIVILEVTLQHRVFRCGYTYGEMRKIAKIATDIFFELKALRGKIPLEELEKTQNSGDVFDPFRFYREKVQTEALSKALGELADATRVGGAYYMLVSYPHFVNIILDLYRVTCSGECDTTEDFMGILSFVFRAFLYPNRDFAFDNKQHEE